MTPPKSLLGADVPPLINLSEDERVKIRNEMSLATPGSPSSSDDVYFKIDDSVKRYGARNYIVKNKH